MPQMEREQPAGRIPGQGGAARDVGIRTSEGKLTRVAIDAQSTVGVRSGIGQYTARLLEAARGSDCFDIVPLTWGKNPPMRLDRRLRWQQMEVPWRAGRARARILHVPGFDAPWLKPCPVVLTVHDLIGMLLPEDLPPASHFYWSRWLPASVRRADRVITDSKHSRDDVVRLLGIPPERIEVIPLGVDVQFSPMRNRLDEVDAVRRRLNLPPTFILFVGNIEPRKGLDTLVDAFSRLVADKPVHLVIAGAAGWYAGRLGDQIRALGLQGRVHAIGYVADEDLPAVFSAATLFAYPSRYEGFGLPPLEAMACGVPVVCSNAASLPEVVGDAAITVPPDDVAALGEALRRVLDDEELRCLMRERGLRRASTFTWQETARRTLAVYGSLL